MHTFSSFSSALHLPSSGALQPGRGLRALVLSGTALALATSAGLCAAQTSAAPAAPPSCMQAHPQPSHSEVVRHGVPNSSFPISAAVEVPGGATTVYLSGTVPPRVDDAKPANEREAYGGGTREQTLGVLRSIESQLKGLGLGMGDIVKMQVFLVADSKKGNTMDFDGFMAGYTQYFGTSAQPRLPVRSAFQIAALANPAWLVEIEVTAVRPAGSMAPARPAAGAAPAGR